MKLNYKDYYDKVYGCWLGKCISGNIGAPFEGMKQYLELEYSDSMLEKMLPNDDLDLQILFLDVVKRFGLEFTSDDLAEYFYANCPYAPGEYAYFKKNYQSGIHPPLTGIFNNGVYHDGMGCTIRSELWACLAPCNPELAVKLCVKEGSLDHYGDGLYGEMFMTALESLAFGESDIDKLVKEAKEFIPENSRLYKVITDTVEWCEKFGNLEAVRKKIIDFYGSAEATSVYQNVGIIIAGLKLCGTDLIDMTVKICACGFDTDCTTATAGSVFGIIHGGKKINAVKDFSDIEYKLGVNAEPRSAKVKDLAEEVASFGGSLNGLNDNVYLFEQKSGVEISVDYNGSTPTLTFGERKKITFKVTDLYKRKLTFKIILPDWLQADKREVLLDLGGSSSFDVEVWLKDGEEYLPMVNTAELDFGVGKFTFGFAGEYRYKVYGPFWRNNVEVPRLKEGQSYWDYFPTDEEGEQLDKIRFYHTNCLPLDKKWESVKEEDYLRTVNTPEDAFVIEDYLLFDGQAKYFFVYEFYSEQSEKVDMQFGFTGDTEVYLNGKLLFEAKGAFRFTPENMHAFKAEVKSGDNKLVIGFTKYTSDGKFGFNFLSNGPCSDHVTKFKIKK